MFPILSILIFLPLAGGIALLFFPAERTGQLSAIRWTAVAIAWMNFLLACVLMLVYYQAIATSGSAICGTVASAANSMFFCQEALPWVSSLGINYNLGVDGISLLLVALTTLLTLVCIGASFRIETKVKNYMAFMLLLSSGIIGVFLATNLFLFYVFWEVMLIPAYFLVGSWGGERRIYAAIKFVLYTSAGSLLMLAGIIAIGYYHQIAAGGSYTLNFADLISGNKIDATTQTWLFLAFAAAFAIKVPFVPFHSWLPDTYSEAPAPVTALLAGAMSKAGAYGFLRFGLQLLPDAAQRLAPLFSILAVIGILYCAVLALVQTDLKRLLGYSSISHLGVVMLAMFSFRTQGVEGSVLQMVNHGITTAALFLIVGYIEIRTKTRDIRDFGGMALRVPALATVMLIAALSSLGLPGLNSFAGEFLALLGTFLGNPVYGILGTAVVIPAAWYLIRFFQSVMEGPRRTEGVVAASERKGVLVDLQMSEFLPLLPLLILIFYIGIQPAPLIAILEQSVANVPNVAGVLHHYGIALLIHMAE